MERPNNIPLGPEMRPGAIVQAENGTPVELGRKLGDGATGIVYEISQEPEQVAKMYFSPSRNAIQEDKVRHEVNNPPLDKTREQYGIPSMTWPTRILRTRTGEFCGFTMYRAPSTASDIQDAYNIVPRKIKYPSGFNYYYQLFAAYNFAVIVQEASDAGYVMGDGINEENLKVDTNALVTALDVDSWQVPDDQGNVLYRCADGRPLWTPPELVGAGDFKNLDQNFYHDNHRLATGIFRLGNLGSDPQGGGWDKHGRNYDKDEFAIGLKEGFSKYYPIDEAHRIALARDLPAEIFPPELQALFEKTFRTGRVLVDQRGNVIKTEPHPRTRPTADDYVEALGSILFPTVNGQVVDPMGRTLSQCKRNSNHIYSSHLDQGRTEGRNCPWDAYIQKFNIPDPYPLT